MVARLNRDAIVAQLEAHGLRFRTVTVQTEGEYLPTDVDWNNKDVPHLNHVHRWVNDVTCVVDRDLQASISLQKALGIPFPLVLVHYDSAPNQQTHVVTLLAWTIVTQHEFITVTPSRTRAVTSYAIGATPFWMLFFPLIGWVVRRNYRQLMSEDVPMRERRGRLRSWGYTFRGDEGPRDIRSTVPIANDNVVPPPAAVDPPTFPPTPLDEIGEAGWTLLGRSDHLGLKVQRQGRRVLVYPRMCPHEGADLDLTPAVDGCLSCPWHGRRLASIASLDLDDDEPRAETGRHRLHVEGGRLHISVIVDRTAPPTSPPAATR